MQDNWCVGIPGSKIDESVDEAAKMLEYNMKMLQRRRKNLKKYRDARNVSYRLRHTPITR
jgi:hypothetical protein